MAGKGSSSNNTVKIVVAALGCVAVVVPATLSYFGQSKAPAHKAGHSEKKGSVSASLSTPSVGTFAGQQTEHFNPGSLIPRGYENLSVGMTAQEANNLDFLDMDVEPDYVGFDIKPPAPFTDAACMFDSSHEVVDHLRFDLAAGNSDNVKNEMITAFGPSTSDAEDNPTWKVAGLVGVLSEKWLMISKPSQ